MRPSRPMPQVGDLVQVVHLSHRRDGRIVRIDERRLLVRTDDGEEAWFQLSRATGRFTAAGQAYSPRLVWPAG